MALKPSKFKLEEMILLAGQPFQVSGMVQLELPDNGVATRYMLTGDKGASQILEERPNRFALLRQFPPSAAPQPNGSEISVMGARYALAGVDKLKVIGAEGGPVGATPSGGLLLSGRFDSQGGAILREIAPGGGAAQTFYALKPIAPDQLMTGQQHAAVQEAQREVAEQQAAAAAETSASAGGWAAKLGGWVVTIIVIGVLVYACSDSEDTSSGSARSGTAHFSGGHGGK